MCRKTVPPGYVSRLYKKRLKFHHYVIFSNPSFCPYSMTYGIYDPSTFFCNTLNPYPTAFPYGNGMVLHFYQQQENSMTKTVHKVINKDLKRMYSRFTLVRISINL